MKPAALQPRRTQQPKLSALFEDHFSLRFLKRFRQLAGVFIARGAHLLIALSAGLLLAGCSGLRIVDSQVSAFSKLDKAPVAGAAWRFERLPSQQNLEDSAAFRRTKLEAIAALELGKAGLAPQPMQANSGQAAYTVQLSARIQRLERGPWDPIEPWPGHSFGWGLPGRDYVVTGSGRVIYTPVFPRVEAPWYVREVSLLIRDAKDNRVVYETQARHEGRWADDEAVLPAMFAAALQGFPKPPEGRRMVNIEIPR
jgi:Domain of unknown function (DUF4136)